MGVTTTTLFLSLWKISGRTSRTQKVECPTTRETEEKFPINVSNIFVVMQGASSFITHTCTCSSQQLKLRCNFHIAILPTNLAKGQKYTRTKGERITFYVTTALNPFSACDDVHTKLLCLPAGKRGSTV